MKIHHYPLPSLNENFLRRIYKPSLSVTHPARLGFSQAPGINASIQ